MTQPTGTSASGWTLKTTFGSRRLTHDQLVQGLADVQYTGLEWVRPDDHDHVDQDYWGPIFGHAVFTPFVVDGLTPREMAEQRAEEQGAKLARLAQGLTTICLILFAVGLWFGTMGWVLWGLSVVSAMIGGFFRYKSSGLILDVARNREACDPLPIQPPPPISG